MIGRIRYKIRESLNYRPILFFPLFNAFGKGKQRAVGPDTEIVIEGFPRSGNSFAVAAFRESQTRSVKIATHLHNAAQIIRATTLGTPTLVLIREPVAAVISLKALGLEVAERKKTLGKEPRHNRYEPSFGDLFNSYRAYYEAILPYRDKFVTASFEEVITDFSKPMIRLNEKFNTQFDIFCHTSESAKAIIGKGSYHLGPNYLRNKIKAKIRNEYDQSCCKFTKNIMAAKEIYNTYKSI